MTIKIFSVAEMVAAEMAADSAGVSYDEMMETAGRGVTEAIIERIAVDGRKVLILVGPGNNGGDGLVAGRYLARAGADVSFYLYKPRDAEMDHNFAQVQEMGLPLIEVGVGQNFKHLQEQVQSCEILIDALLGTGVTRPIGGNLAAVFNEVRLELNRRFALHDEKRFLTSIAQVRGEGSGPREPFITAVDCPSGLNCDSGELDPLAIAADLTVTFAGPKRGHFNFPGAAACGELVVTDIGITTSLAQVEGVTLELMTAERARELLPDRQSAGHKGSFGTALIAAGSDHYWGAPLLAAQGAYRVGAGLVALAVPSAIRSTIAGQMPEATYPLVTAVSLLDEASAGLIMAMIDRIKGILIGPGLGLAQDFMRLFLDQMIKMQDNAATIPAMVVDADALNVLAGWPDWPQQLPPHTILTPHPGELARLMGVSIAYVSAADRVDLARAKAMSWGHILVMKGAYTVVAAPNGRCTLIPFANPLLAVGGSGDVLGGIIVGLLAQGLEPYEAAVLGAYLHGAAAQLAVEQYGDAGMLPGELAQWIPKVRMQLLGKSDW